MRRRQFFAVQKRVFFGLVTMDAVPRDDKCGSNFCLFFLYFVSFLTPNYIFINFIQHEDAKGEYLRHESLPRPTDASRQAYKFSA